MRRKKRTTAVAMLAATARIHQSWFSSMVNRPVASATARSGPTVDLMARRIRAEPAAGQGDVASAG